MSDLIILHLSSEATHCDHGVLLVWPNCPLCTAALAAESKFKHRPKLPCTRLFCNDPFCDRPHLCAECGQEDCSCGTDCLSDRDYWLERSELVR